MPKDVDEPAYVPDNPPMVVAQKKQITRAISGLVIMLGVVIALCATGCSRGPRPVKTVVGIDMNHSKGWPGLAEVLMARGWEVMPIDHAIETETLDKIGVLIIASPTTDYAGAEVRAIKRFVKEGGGLVCAGQAWSWTYKEYENKPVETHPLNQLGKSLGFEVTSDSIGKPTYLATDVMKGIGTLVHTDWWPSRIAFSSKDAAIVVRDDQQRIAGGSFMLGHGRVAVYGHGLLLEQNPEVLRNTVAFVGRFPQ